MYRRLILAAFLVLLVPGTARAGFKEAVEAYQRGDFATAFRELQPLADQGVLEAEYNLGILYEKGEGVDKDLVKAADWYRKAAAQGDPLSDDKLGVFYLEGWGVPQDPTQAAQWLTKAAEAGLPWSQLRLAGLYYTGRGVPKDPAKAAEWARKGADAGLPEAQATLGTMYLSGTGVAADPNEAAKWYLRAAQQGHVKSQFNLGALYANGDIPQNLPEAYFWLSLAAASSFPNAESARDQVASSLSDVSLTKLKARLKEWRPQAEPLGGPALASRTPNGAPALADPVSAVQKELKRLGYKIGKPDGHLGPATKRSITAFQRKSKLPPTGKVDARLLAALGLTSTLQVPPPAPQSDVAAVVPPSDAKGHDNDASTAAPSAGDLTSPGVDAADNSRNGTLPTVGFSPDSSAAGAADAPFAPPSMAAAPDTAAPTPPASSDSPPADTQQIPSAPSEGQQSPGQSTGEATQVAPRSTEAPSVAGTSASPLPKPKPMRATEAIGRVPPVKPAPKTSSGNRGSAAAASADVPTTGAGASQQAAAVPEVQPSAGPQRLSLAFQAAQTRLDPGARASLDGLARTMAGAGGTRIKLVSYASGNSPEGDRQLALNRALEVRSYLMSKGIGADAIDVNVVGSAVAVEGEKPNRIDLVPVAGP